ncbi:hypothetical protein [Sphingomonas rubra]|uniref:Uncharacterized protein n=1 Tax=Sphingomonas rubra TaxID=634430 RepID=A0A1I5UDV6_9SPHN|nr:hypothetical protein [Sphingomonas rubra]SFP93431.1 hypothetical protein SAMN04488241_11198 [Sphingomonas rubra]
MTAVQTTSGRHRLANDVVATINEFDQKRLDEMGGWQPLADLSGRTQFEAIDGDPDSVVFVDENRFQAIATVYVILVYGSGNDEDTMSDEYVATIQGHRDAGGIVIDSIEVDTTPFYE